MTTTTHNTDTSTLDRFAEMWGAQSMDKIPGEREAKLLRRHGSTYSIRCGRLYKFDEAVMTDVRASDDQSRHIARLHRLNLLTIVNGKIVPSQAGKDLMKNYL